MHLRHPSLYLSSAFFPSSFAMYSRPRARFHYRGGGEGRGQYQRGYSEGPGHPITSENQLVTGDSHFQSVRATNLGLPASDYSRVNYNYACNGVNPANSGRYQGQIYYQWSRPQYNRNSPADFGFRPHVSSNERPQRPFQQPLMQNDHQQQQPRRPKTNDYRRWEVAKNPPPPTHERFSILSYNILADYLANDHRSKLYYHIPRRFMDWQWRRKGIVFELGLWSPDIMCFQEVDKFSDLEEDLRTRGYVGIWKRRTGIPVDGCAMFWRTSRFKLVHEEHIEFNKHGMRDNVAQVCVLESLIPYGNGDQSASSKSPTGTNKVVICNIHVLFNPRRGEMKLGQVRVLLDKAQAVSKLWNDAPIVLCGDFNSTPKSPLYNFISEQKIDLSELDRDKVSGQASAEIPSQPRESRPQSGEKYNAYSSNYQYNASSEKQLRSKSYSENKVQAAVLSEGRDKAAPESRPAKAAFETSQEAVDFLKDETGTASHVSNDHLKDSQNGYFIDNENSAYQSIDESGKNLRSATPGEKIVSSFTERNDEERLTLSESEIYEEVQSMNSEEKLRTASNNFSINEEISEKLALASIDEAKASTVLRENNSDASIAITFDVSDNFEGLSLEELDKKAEDIGVDCEKFLSDLHRGDEILEDLSPRINSESVDVENITNKYDPSLWTPMEIKTATGNADCTLLQHSLKLRSAYAEVEGSSETREISGEPVLTSYNRSLMGTVDYIWRSDGLKTVRVLAPLPKSAVEWSQGFPTRKWGSDHIALVSELAFTKDGE